jgi:starch phosphorylase
MVTTSFTPGAADLAARIDVLADRLSDGLKPLAAIAYNYAWSWTRDGADVFRDINPHRWELSGANPVRFLGDLWPGTVEAAERNPALLERVQALSEEMGGYLGRPDRPRPGIDGPVAFFCAEFGFHPSMPIYSGGLGVLAGDILKEASDQALQMVGIGLFYRRGYFRQRLDGAGRQQEYWLASDPKSMPMARVTGADGRPLLLDVPLDGDALRFQVWRVDVGRVPLLLLDSELPENDAVQRWTSARLYDGSRAVRLAQYGLLGLGGARVLQALGIDPAVIHLNEGHPALAVLELAAGRVAQGATFDQALAELRPRVVFTTHTPVAAGNETYSLEEFLGAFGGLPSRLGIGGDAFLKLARATPDGPPGMTPLALRLAGRRNGVSELHGRVARGMWQSLFGVPEADVPIAHVTNGAHIPTFLGDPMYRLLAEHLGDDWLARAADPVTWEGVRAIPNGELWAARCDSRERLVAYVRAKGQQDRLLRGEQLAYVRAIEDCLDPSALTLGFARRLATYKRLYLLTHDADRARRILGGPRAVQLLIAGKAHPNDEDGKDALQRVYNLKREDGQIAERVVFVEDYDIDIARHLVSGCDVWVNLPRKPMEASGTSGMKAAFNGVLQLSVLDGWWAEGFDGENGWGIDGDEDPDQAAADERDATAFYDLLENEVVPLFYDRDAHGVPVAWCEKVKASLATCAPRFSATRMVDDYAARMYPRSLADVAAASRAASSSLS